MDKKWALVKEWFRKGDNDLKNARIVIEAEEPPTDTVCFHSQQTAEKYLKGFLSYHNIEFKKEHDLSYLLDLCCQIDPSFNFLYDMAEKLTVYGVESRYPTDIFYEYPVEEAREAIEIAEHIKEFVRKNIGLNDP